MVLRNRFGCPLVGVAADEAVEVLKAHADRPLVERPVLAGLERRHVVILAEPRRAVAVVLEDAADRRLIALDDAVVTGVTGGLLGDHAETDRVMVAPGDQRRARGRAQRRRVEVRVAQAIGSDPVKIGRWNHATEGARSAVAGIVSDDQQYVRGSLGRLDAGGPIGRGLSGVALDLAAELLRERRQLLTNNRSSGIG